MSRNVVNRLPISTESPGLVQSVELRVLRLNCVTSAYADLWEACWAEEFLADSWASSDHILGEPGAVVGSERTPLAAVGPEWTRGTPLRKAADRRRVLLEIDALVALSLGITADELCTIYRTQFPVLYGYDRKDYLYDTAGRLVPTSVQQIWRKKGHNDGTFTDEDLTAPHPGSGIEYTYQLPFHHLDREADLRAAYTEFEQQL